MVTDFSEVMKPDANSSLSSKKKVKIPDRLRKENFRFIKLARRKKEPIERGWQKGNNYRHDDKRLLDHIESGGNYGVLTGVGGLVVIDADREKVSERIEENLPETFVCRTGGGGRQYYYFCEDLKNPIRLEGDEPGDIGDVQAQGKQVVGPNSVHPNGIRYRVLRHGEISGISESELIECLLPFLRERDIERGLGKRKRNNSDIENFKSEVDISEVIEEYVPQARSGGYYWQGICPFHPDENPSFTVYSDNYYCFGCGAHGDVIDFVQENEDVDFKTALKRIEEITGAEPPKAFSSNEKVAKTIEIEGCNDVKIWFDDLYRRDKTTRGTINAKIGDQPHCEEDKKISNKNLKTFCKEIQLSEELEDSQRRDIYKGFLRLKPKARKEAGGLGEGRLQKGGGKAEEDLFREEELSDECLEEATQIIERGKIFPEILGIYEPHQGDCERKFLLFCSLVSKKLTGNSINDHSVGTSGKGKSHLMRIMANGVPNEHKLVRDSISAKYLYYLTEDYGADSLDGELLYYDDVTLDEEKEATLKTVTDPGPTDEATHGTVKDQFRYDLKIEGLPTVWLTSVDVFSSEQLRNRFFIDQPNEGEDLDDKVANFQKMHGRRGNLNPERLVDYDKAKALYRQVIDSGLEELEVLIPFDWEWNLESDRRIQPLFLTLLHVVTKLHHKKRIKLGKCVFSNFEDFYLAKLIMNKFLRQTTGKMTDKMVRIWMSVGIDEDSAKTRSEISQQSGLGVGAVRYQLDQKKGASLTDLGFVNREKKDGEWHYWKTEKEPVKSCARVSQESQSFDGLEKQFKEILSGCENSVYWEGSTHTYDPELFEEYKLNIYANSSLLPEISQDMGMTLDGFNSLFEVGEGCETVSHLITSAKRKFDEPNEYPDFTPLLNLFHLEEN